MIPADFIRKWDRSSLKESASAQQHFLDLCELVGEKKPADVDPTGESYGFEKGATKSTGRQGFADVWKRGHFGWEYKGPNKDLDRAYRQLLTYSVALENPPLLIVSDTKKIIIRTNWTNTVQETHEISLDDLHDAAKRDIIKFALSDPQRLKPKKTRAELTAAAADEFSALAQRLRERAPDGADREDYARTVAHFVNRLVFCMFAEDVRLLPNNIFTRMLEMCVHQPEEFAGYARKLFAAMKTKDGAVGFEKIDWFNGGLFDDDEALAMDADDVALCLKAAKLYWGDIDPSILGTLFERGLDPSKRSQLGAHYTDADKIMMIVGPVIVEPLAADWAAAKAQIAAELEREKKAKSKTAATRAHKAALALHGAYIDRLAAFRVLDPACGSGNFLYLSLLELKQLEHKANLDAEQMGLPRGFPRVGPEAVKGIEINPYAAELARVSIWIGEIQWMRRNGFDAARNPILRSLNNIECRDALIEKDAQTGEWREAAWPDADVIVGNPPFLGGKRLIGVMGQIYVLALRMVYKNRLPDFADLVCFWFERANAHLNECKSRRFGLVATNSITGGANRTVLDKLVKSNIIYCAYADEPWVVDGASVRVSLVCASNQNMDKILLEQKIVEKINSDLSSTKFIVSSVVRLSANENAAFVGLQPSGTFDIDGAKARDWLMLPANVNGRKNKEVLRPYWNSYEVTRRARDVWIIDFGELDPEAAAYFEEPFSHAEAIIKPQRLATKVKNPRDREWLQKYWWRHWRSRPEFREAVDSLARCIATPLVSKHRVFRWAPNDVAPSNLIIAIARDDDTTFGILHSKFHELWSLRMGTSLEDRPRYTPTTCFETFPFPEGLTPDIPASDYADDARAGRIAEAAARLNELRENWLNPPDLVRREPEVVAGYPDRILPVDERAAAILKKRTLTNLYNERPAWLEHAHAALDLAVAGAYGWEADFAAGGLGDEEILKRLFDLNQSRAARPS